MKKRLISLVLTIAMCMSFIPVISLPVSAAEDKIEQALSNDAPKYSEENPYGTGSSPFLLLEQSEALLYYSSESIRQTLNVYDKLGYSNNTYSEFNSGNTIFFDDSYGNNYTKYSFVQGVALDPFGSGRKDHIAFVGVKDQGDGNYSAYIWVVNGRTGARLGDPVRLAVVRWTQRAMAAADNSNNPLDYKDDLEEYAASNFFSITAGDYDGNGKDSLVVYVAGDVSGTVNIGNVWSRGATLYEYGVTSSGLTACWSRSKFCLHSDYINQENSVNTDFGKPSTKLSCVLKTGDFNDDGSDDLAVLSYINNTGKAESINMHKYSLCVVNGAYNGGSILAASENIRIMSCSGKYEAGPSESASGGTTRMFLTGGNMSVGDINNDGVDDLVVAGIARSQFVSSNNVSTYEFDGGWSDGYVKMSITPFLGSKSGLIVKSPVVKDTDENSFSSKAYSSVTFSATSNDRRVWQQVGMACFALSAKLQADYVFIDGVIYYYDANKNAFDGWTMTGFNDFSLSSETYTDIYFTSVIASNFDNNAAGREQVMYVIGCKSIYTGDGGLYEDKDNYSYTIGVTGGSSFTDTETYFDRNHGTHTIPTNTPQSNRLIANLPVNKYPCNIKDENGGYLMKNCFDDLDSGLNCLLIAADVDNDGLYVKYDGAESVYSDPEVAAVLQAAPYFSELGGSGNNATSYQLTTTYEISKETTSGSSVGVDVTLSQGFGNVFEISLKAGLSLEWSESFAKSLQTEYTASFSATSYNTVVVKRTPVSIYSFVAAKADGTFPTTAAEKKANMVSITIPRSPTYISMSVDDYNEYVTRYNQYAPSGLTLVQINKNANYFSGNEGNPSGYTTSISSLSHSAQISKNWIAVDKANAITSISWSTGNTQSATTETNTSLHFGFSMAVGGVGAETNLENQSGQSQSKTTGTVIGMSGAVQGIDAKALLASGVSQSVIDNYYFEWSLIKWERNLGGTRDSRTPFIGYCLRNVKCPPHAVNKATVTNVSADSITLNWQKPSTASGRAEATSYVVYKIEKSAMGSVSYYKMQEVTSAGTNESCTITGLSGSTDYSFAISARDANGKESVPSTPIEVKTPIPYYSVTYSGNTDQADISVKQNASTVNSGDTFREGTVINISVFAKECFALDCVKVITNGKTETVTPTNGAVSFSVSLASDISIMVLSHDTRRSFDYNYNSAHADLTFTVNGVLIASGSTLTEGTTLNYSALPKDGCKLDKLYININGNNSEISPDADGNISGSITVTENMQFTLSSYDTRAHGSASYSAYRGTVSAKLKSGGADYMENTDTSDIIVFTAIPNDSDYKFQKWEVTKDGITVEYTGEIFEYAPEGTEAAPSSITVRAVFVDARLCSFIGFGVDTGDTTGSITAVIKSNGIPYVQCADAMETILFTATPADGYVLEKWVVEHDGSYRFYDVTDETMTFDITPTGTYKDPDNYSIYAVFKLKSALKRTVTIIPPSEGGSIRLEVGGEILTIGNDNTVAVPYDVPFLITAVPAAGCCFDAWSGDLAGYKHGAVVMQTKTNITVGATFLIPSRSHLSYEAVCGDGVTGSVAPTSLLPTGNYLPTGTEVKMSAFTDTANTRIVKWEIVKSGVTEVITLDEYITNDSVTVTVDASTTVRAYFVARETYTVSITPSYPVDELFDTSLYGTRYWIDESGDGDPATATFSEAFTEAAQVSLLFGQTLWVKTNEVEYMQEPSGKDPYVYRFNASGWTEDSYRSYFKKIDCIGADQAIDFPVSYTKVTFPVGTFNFESTDNCEITAEISLGSYYGRYDSGDIYLDTPVILTATPVENYVITRWLIGTTTTSTVVNNGVEEEIVTFNGEPLKNADGTDYTGTTYTAIPTSELTVKVEVAGKSLNVVCGTPKGGTISGLSEAVRYGDLINLSASPDKNYTFEGWHINGEFITDSDYSFTATTDLTCNAIFSPKEETAVSITVLAKPVQDKVYIGGTPDYNGLVVVAAYSDGSEVNATYDCTLSAVDTSTLGKKTVAVTLDRLTTSFEIEVVEFPTIKTIITYDERANLAGVKKNEIYIAIKLISNPGVTAVRLPVYFDTTKLTLTDISDGGILGEALHSATLTPNADGCYILNWSNPTAKENFTVNGTIVNMTFKLKDGTNMTDIVNSFNTEAPAIKVTVTADSDNILNKNAERVAFIATSTAPVSLSETTLGDVNGDGYITQLDVFYLSRYIAQWEGYDALIIYKNCDLNGDGWVTQLDAFILARHIAGWPDYNSFPYIS